MPTKIPTVKLSDERIVPMVGLGTWRFKPGEAANAIKTAIDYGYRHIDCACIYLNEAEIGEGIKKTIEAGVVSRSDIFVTSKLWNTYHSRGRVLEGCQKSLKNLGLDYIDLFLIHWPIAYEEGDDLSPKDKNGEHLTTNTDFIETWKGMEDLKEEGLVRSIGLSNFNHEQISLILDICKFKPVMLQMESHPYLSQDKLIEFCRTHDIAVTAYSPLGSPDRPWLKENEPFLLGDAKVNIIARRHNKTPAQILLRYQVQRGVIVIPKSVTPARMQENIQLFDFELSESEIVSLSSSDIAHRYCHLNRLKYHPFYPFSLEY